MESPDVVVAGAGLIGLSCALGLRSAGLRVVVLERGQAAREASWAAAGMLAANDPAHPDGMQLLATRSIELYDGFLGSIAAAGGGQVAYETKWTLEQENGADEDATLAGLARRDFRRHAEKSLDPRKLTAALRQAVLASGVELREDVAVQSAVERRGGVEVQTKDGTLHGGNFLDCTGAWSRVPVKPAKGHMLRVQAPGLFHVEGLGNVVVRTPELYMVPRLDGTVVIGASVEDVGFDRSIRSEEIDALRAKAAALLPALADVPEAERWIGFRPDTPDHLPLLGRTGEHSFVASGHFRNGILLAPATSRLMTELIREDEVSFNLERYNPGRFVVD